ncbi:MAG TPA: DUF2336 domain-containing protein [Xanthobacteraceae bacterium]|jgi:uncharacterized protein (DUF2336 family)
MLHATDETMNIRELKAAVAHVAPDRRAHVLGQVTDLFVLHAATYSADEIALFDDVIARLAAEIEVEARILLAHRLAQVPNAPGKVIRMLAFDDCVEVATPVLTHSEQLPETTLVENAQTKSQKHLFAISRRSTLGEPVTDVLVERGDRAVAISVAGNTGARFSEKGYLGLVKRSAGDDMLAERLGTRREIPAHLFLKLLSAASERVRDRLRASHPQAGGEIDRVVETVAGRIRSRVTAVPRNYADSLEELGDRLIAGRLGEGDLVKFCQAGKFEDAVVTLALLAHVPVPLVDRAMYAERPDVLLAITRAINLKWSTVKLVLQLRAAPHILAPDELQHSLAAFEHMSPATAAHLMRFHAAAAS